MADHSLRIKTLGGLSIERNGEVVRSFASRKAEALLLYLVCNPREHPREVLAELLWDDRTQRQAMANLRVLLASLRKGVGPYVTITRTTAGINNRADIWLDVAELEAAASPLRQRTHHPSSHAVEVMTAAVEYYAGDFLEGFFIPDAGGFEAWVTAERERLHRLVAEALQEVGRWHLSKEDTGGLLASAARLLEIDPLSEVGCRQMMEALARGGKRGQALALFEQCRQRLWEELGIKPAPETAALYETIRAGKMAEWQPVERPGSQPPHNLPPQSTPFIGRESELEALGRHLFDPTIRLITILGPGGIGKTRLAIAAAEAPIDGREESSQLFPQGVYFVSLAALETADLLVPAIAKALNFQFYEGDEPKAQLLRYLHQKAMLLVLDNFEHLRAGADLVDEILGAAPAVKLLVTSREKLNRQAEQMFPIAGLAVPPEEVAGEADNAALTGYSAIQLFCQSARRVRPDFALSASNRSQVLEICRLVQGMPLGIVLAAAWLELLTPQEIVAEMGQDLDFLATEMGDVPERQRSLRAAFNHSWRLLSDQGQKVFLQLSIFRGGFTRKAAEAVAGASLRVLQALANKSLLSLTAGGRYEVHELLRQFGAERLAQAPEMEAAVRDRHSTFYCALLHQHTEQWHTARQLETLAAVTREADNMQIALRWALAEGKWRRLAQAIDSWGRFLDWQGRFADGDAFCRTIIETAERQSKEGALSPDYLLARANALAWLGLFTVDSNVAMNVLQQSLALLERPELAGKDTRQEKAFVLVYEVANLRDDLTRARPLAEYALALYRELGNRWGIAHSLHELGFVDLLAGNYDASRETLRAALAIHRELGNRQRQASCMGTLAIVHKVLGDLDQSERLGREVLAILQQIGDRSSIAGYYGDLAHTLLYQGKFAGAHQLAEEALAICRDLGQRSSESWPLSTMCETLLHTGQYEQARQLAERTLSLARESKAWEEGVLCWVLGEVALVASYYAEAQTAFAASAALTPKMWKHGRGISLAGLAYAAWRQGQLSQARHYLVEALTNGLAFTAYMSTVHVLPVAALLLAETDEATYAVELWALAKRHPYVANSKWFEDVAGRKLDELAATMPAAKAAAARTRGEARDVWATVDELLQELKHSGNG